MEDDGVFIFSFVEGTLGVEPRFDQIDAVDTPATEVVSDVVGICMNMSGVIKSGISEAVLAVELPPNPIPQGLRIEPEFVVGSLSSSKSSMSRSIDAARSDPSTTASKADASALFDFDAPGLVACDLLVADMTPFCLARNRCTG
eukprot:m.733440 g.733440  ORF g.733440 m.733440 type:complete len:144 (-) comp23071_c0_seq4:192-623(-)